MRVMDMLQKPRPLTNILAKIAIFWKLTYLQLTSFHPPRRLTKVAAFLVVYAHNSRNEGGDTHRTRTE